MVPSHFFICTHWPAYSIKAYWRLSLEPALGVKKKKQFKIFEFSEEGSFLITVSQFLSFNSENTFNIFLDHIHLVFNLIQKIQNYAWSLDPWSRYLRKNSNNHKNNIIVCLALSINTGVPVVAVIWFELMSGILETVTLALTGVLNVPPKRNLSPLTPSGYCGFVHRVLLFPPK